MRLILDTNLWSDIGDESVAAEFDDLVDRQGIEVLVPPSILVEVCRLSVRELSDPIVRALAMGPRRRLPTEAESESAELVAEIRRAKPQWMRKMPDSARVASLNAFWTRRVWRIALDVACHVHGTTYRASGWTTMANGVGNGMPNSADEADLTRGPCGGPRKPKPGRENMPERGSAYGRRHPASNQPHQPSSAARFPVPRLAAALVH